MTESLKVAIAGLGTVGAGVAEVLLAREANLSARAGRGVKLVAASAKDTSKAEGLDLKKFAWENDVLALASRKDVDCVVELIGGEEGAARALVEAALKNKKHVVTANKALLAKHGAALAELAEKNGVALKFEAAAAGGIPIVKSLRESLIAYDVTAVRGILNGTCNYILTEMEATGKPFAEVLKEAQKLGYAEADPTLDVGGGDTAHKLALLSCLAFGTKPDLGAIAISGIERVSPADISFAKEFGYRLKLLGVARKTQNGVDQRVNLAMVKADTPIASVGGSFNAVIVDCGDAGMFFFEGRGAGRAPTASAVVSDIVDIARGSLGHAFGRPVAELTAAPKGAAQKRESAYYLRFQVRDVPGVMAGISRHLADERVSIESMLQRGQNAGESVTIAMITHEASYEAVTRALQAIGASDKVLEPPCMIPMESV